MSSDPLDHLASNFDSWEPLLNSTLTSVGPSDSASTMKPLLGVAEIRLTTPGEAEMDTEPPISLWTETSGWAPMVVDVVVVVDVIVVVGFVVEGVADVIEVLLGTDPAVVVDVDAGGGVAGAVVVPAAVVVVPAAVVAGSAGAAGAGTSSAESGWMESLPT